MKKVFTDYYEMTKFLNTLEPNGYVFIRMIDLNDGKYTVVYKKSTKVPFKYR